MAQSQRRSQRGSFRPFTPSERETRRTSVPRLTYPAQLPVSARKDDIAAAIREHQVVIIAGETGSGKTTQLPKICLELGRGIEGMIGHTQPRRIAARSVAERLCQELGVELGTVIGYQVRFTEVVSRSTLVKLMTDGILLAEIQSDPELRRYDTIIIDEAHERSLNIDFLLGYLANLLPRRPDLKLIITSATIDSQKFAQHFTTALGHGAARSMAPAPVLTVTGRTYPVEVRYRPLDATIYRDDAVFIDGARQHNDGARAFTPVGHDVTPDAAQEAAPDQITGILQASDELMAEGPGDILVFLSGEGEIRETQKALRDHLGQRYVEAGEHSNTPGAVEVLPLFARLSSAEQHRIFAPHQYRRIVLATNIAETSLTVPGIRYVIDPGTARISRFSNKTKVQRLPIEPISQASANQRSGRCGRVADGIAIRLYSEEDFLARAEFTEPEIQRTSLASVILQMAALNLGDVEHFPFVDPPDVRAVSSGIQLLEEIQAVQVRPNKSLQLTKIGRDLARLPIDPRLGRMLLAAADSGCTAEVLVLVAAMSVQDVRERPLEFKAQADQLHARFTDPTSDFLAYLHLWRYLRTQQRELSGSAFRKMCRAEYLNWLRFREWQDVVDQLRQLAKPLGLHLKPITIPKPAQLREAAQEDADNTQNRDVVRAVKAVSASADTPATDAIHQALLVGLLSNLGNWDERKHDYAGARGTHFVIWPGSGLYRRNPKWVMAAELVETSRLFARTVARIDSDWVERAASHLVKHTYSDAFWSSRNGAALVHEKVTLYGMTLVAERQTLLAKAGLPEAKALARELFIRHALVENQWRSHHKFVSDNQTALEEASQVESRRRQYGLVADENARFVFFDERIPEHIVSSRHFDSWWKRERHKNPQLLNYTQAFLLGEEAADDADFPATWRQGQIELPISYDFKPGSYSDGLTIDVPITLLPQLVDAGFDWLVPGMRSELIVATIRALPKNVRRSLVPAPDVAAQLAKLLPPAGEIVDAGAEAPSFRQCFTAAVRELRGVEISESDWAQAELPGHLEITFVVRSERGAVLDQGPSLTALQNSLAGQTHSAVESVVKSAVAQALDTAREQILADVQAEQREAQHRRNAKRQAQEREEHARAGGQALSVDASAMDVDDLRQWPAVQDGILPEVVETVGTHEMLVRGYPALVAQPNLRRVTLRVLADPAVQVREHAQGVVQLLALELALPQARITTRWTGTESLLLSAAPGASTADFVADLQLAAARNIAKKWSKEAKIKLGRLRSEDDYQKLRSYTRDRLEDEVYRIARIVVRIMSTLAELRATLDATKSIALVQTVDEIREHVNTLVYPGFVAQTPDEYLAELPRYLGAAKIRLVKAAQNPQRDADLAWEVHDVETLVAQARFNAHENSEAHYDSTRTADLERARWMLEELRVSLFAQQLGTKGKVSAQRIEKLLAGQ